jgi:hypothetical protein
VVRNSHVLEVDSFGVFEERIGSPDLIEPTNRQQSVLAGHVVRQLQSVVLPALSEKYVRYKSLISRERERERENNQKFKRFTRVIII